MVAIDPRIQKHVDQIEEWLFQLDLPALTQPELTAVLAQLEAQDIQADGEEKILFEHLVALCQRRYVQAHFWPDFKLIGFDAREKILSRRKRIFAIGLI